MDAAGLRVAHVVHRYPPALGGSESYFARLSRTLAAAGDRVTVCTTTALDLPAFWSPRARSLPPGPSCEDGVEVRRYAPAFRVRGRRFLLKPLSLLAPRPWQAMLLPCNPITPDLWRDAGHGKPACDLVHASAFPYGWILACGLRLARARGVPFVVTPFLHTGDPDDPHDPTRRAYLAPGLRVFLEAADRVFAQTTVERDALLALGLPPERIVLQGLGVDPAECTGGDRTRARAAWGIGPGQVVVGHLANQSFEKGTVDLLQAVARLGDAGWRLRLVLAGPQMPNFVAFWNAFRRRCPQADTVVQLGPLTDAARRDFFAGLDLFALPSRSDSFGLVFPEAWANGVPSIAYRAGGVPGVIRDGQDGMLVPCGDVDGLAAALARLSADAALRRTLGEAGRARLPRDFRWHDKLQLVRDVYRDLAASRAARTHVAARVPCVPSPTEAPAGSK